jgi:hypothetical protein
MCFFAVEDKPGRQRTAQFAQAGERFLPGRITAYLESSRTGDSNLNAVSFLQLQRLDDCGG